MIIKVFDDDFLMVKKLSLEESIKIAKKCKNWGEPHTDSGFYSRIGYINKLTVNFREYRMMERTHYVLNILYDDSSLIEGEFEEYFSGHDVEGPLRKLSKLIEKIGEEKYENETNIKKGLREARKIVSS